MGYGHHKKNAVKPQQFVNSGLLLYGWHAVTAALANPQRTKTILYVTPDMQAKLGVVPCPVEVLDKHVLSRLLPPNAVHQGIALRTEPLQQPYLENVMGSGTGRQCLIMLDQVTDPHNVGAILRSAAAFSAQGVIVQNRHAPEESGLLAKTASGALERLPYMSVTNLARSLRELQEAGYWCIGFDSAATSTLTPAAIPDKVVLVFGAEGEGLRRLVRETCDAYARLDTHPDFPSLNVSNAVACALQVSNLASAGG